MTDSERADLFRRRGHKCEICHERQATDLHHCLFRRDKHKPELNHEINYQCLCHYCHMMGYGDTLDNRRAFYILQVERYGFDVLWAWVEDLPFKIRQYDFVDMREFAAYKNAPATC